MLPDLLLWEQPLEAGPPLGAGPELLDWGTSSDESLLFRFCPTGALVAAAIFSTRFSAIFE
jgi:hypothetical protein